MLKLNKKSSFEVFILKQNTLNLKTTQSRHDIHVETLYGLKRQYLNLLNVLIYIIGLMCLFFLD